MPALASPSTDDDTFVALFEANFDYVWRTLRRLGASAADAEDLTQEVFLVVHRKLASFDRARPLKPWLFGIARNALRDHRRLARHHREQLTARDEAKSDPNIRALEAAELVYLALAQLDEPLRAVVVLRDMQELSMKETAHILDVPIDTAFGRLRRGREQLRRLVDELDGGTLDE